MRIWLVHMRSDANQNSNPVHMCRLTPTWDSLKRPTTKAAEPPRHQQMNIREYATQDHCIHCCNHATQSCCIHCRNHAGTQASEAHGTWLEEKQHKQNREKGPSSNLQQLCRAYMSQRCYIIGPSRWTSVWLVSFIVLTGKLSSIEWQQSLPLART